MENISINLYCIDFLIVIKKLQKKNSKNFYIDLIFFKIFITLMYLYINVYINN